MDDGPIIGARLRQAREAAGMSLSQLAARVPFARSTLHAYETGARIATADVIACYEQVCGQFADPVTVMAALGRADVDRRSFLLRTVYSAALSATGLVSLSDIARLIRIDAGTTVSMPEVNAVRAVTDAFVHLDEVKGGGAGRSAVAEFMATDVAAMLRARFPDLHTRAQAFSAASELAYLVGFKSHDAGKDGVAQRYFLSALRLAEESGIPGQDAFCFRILALHGNDVDDPQYSPQLAERAMSQARGLSPDAQLLFQAAVARTHAEAGNRREALAALRSAESRIGSDITTELPRWITLWCPNRASALRQTAKAFLSLGDVVEAERHHRLSHEIWNPKTHSRIHAITAAETGLLRWRIGNHEDAAALWRPALPVLATVNSDRATKLLTKIRRAAPEVFPTAV